MQNFTGEISYFKEATREQMHSFEETLNIKFPLDYKEYIKEFNGSLH